MSDGWLKCDVMKGMFSDESVVRIATASGTNESFFVPKSSVDAGRVRVQILSRNGTAAAVLPTDYAETVFVRDEDLSPA